MDSIDSQPDQLGNRQRDCVARCGFSAELTEAAEVFLMNAFSGTLVTEVPSTLIGAAMTIVCGLSWIQPTADQLRAGGLLPAEDSSDDESKTGGDTLADE